jgi:PAS domain S-box-containing protein
MNTKPKILIVDDKPENLVAIRVVLKDLDIELVEATSGNEALKATLRHDFALALLDIQMPEMDGYELAGILREEEKTMHLPFIFISAVYTDNLNVFKGYEKGAFSFITKPFQPEILINKVKFFIDKHQQEITLFELNEDLKRKVKEIADYKYALDESSIVAITDQKGIIKEVNNNFCTISKYTREELIGQDHRMINSGYHSKEFMKDLWTTISGGKIWRGEVKNRAKDETVFWLDTTIVPFLNEDGKPYQYMTIRSEITQRKDAEDQLQEVNEELGRNVKQISDYKYALNESSIVAISDQKWIIKEVNNNFCTISKYSREELIGQDLRMMNSEYHPKEFIQDVWITISSGKIWRGELKNKAKDGTFYWVDTTIVPFLNVDGIPYQYMTIRSDITSRKKAEDKLQAVNKELEAFSYSVSHDLRAPLRAINGYAEILNEDYGTKLDDEGKRIIEIIRDNTTRMGILIDDLLSFSRLGRKEIQMTEIDMNEMAKEVMVELNISMAHHAKIKIGKLHKVKADYSLLRQVMFNLISNAVKYSSKKENPVVEISSEDKNGEIIFSVKDNGAGFDMRYADKLFGVFQRLHSQDEFEGTGVGLAIVQRIISRHKGRSWAEGKVNEGATFYFSFPKN